ncbi:MAG: efflux transporter outer membrane subunit [Gammaproteobacteria bacterium]|nr:efflux transporter outer membrane subunit [Gammaproteobacteria bacterium]MCW5584310.1 efflux transporter outer membrane subunit [Gammaproteobacteria bacterium]
MHFYRVTFFVLSALLTSCTVGPNYVRPSANVPAVFKEAKGKQVIAAPSKDWKIARPKNHCERGEWWRTFHDPTLNELEAKLNFSNQDIVTAEANYRQARALVDEARSSFFPTLTGAASMTRQKNVGGSTTFTSELSSGTTTSGVATTGGLPVNRTARLSTNYSLLLDASWELDIWGLVQRQVEASAASAQASAALLASTRLSAQGLLAQYYFELRGTEAGQKLLDETVKEYKKGLQLAENKYHTGIVSRADVVQAKSQLESAQALAINNGIARAQYEHAIAVLMGIPPAQFSIARYPSKTHAIPPSIPLEIPSALLERRPDIAQAERLMQQANAQIGIAMAAYFPSLTLSAASSFSGTTLAHWISLPNMAWSYGPQFSQIIFDGGSRKALVKAAQAGYDASVSSYRQTVLMAFQEVEDSLASLRILNQQSIVQNQAAISARQALKLILNQYQAGTVDYSDVIVAQTVAYAAEKNAVDVNSQRMAAAVGLVKALGGGWDAAAIRYAAC